MAECFFENCQSTDLRRTPSHPVPRGRRSGDKVLKLTMARLCSFRRQTQKTETCAHTRRAPSTGAFGVARVFEASSFLASGLDGSFHLLWIFPADAFVAVLTQRNRRREHKVEACRRGRNTFFQAAKGGKMHRPRASVFSSFSCRCFSLRQELCRHHPSKTLEAVFCASVQRSSLT